METYPMMVEGLDVNETDEGVVVYDEATDRVHHLNHTAALILHLCDGSRDARSIADFLAASFQLQQAPLEETHACLAKLAAEGLVR